jgi:hypothetical protein
MHDNCCETMLQYKHFFFINAIKSAEYLIEFLSKIIVKSTLKLFANQLFVQNQIILMENCCLLGNLILLY